MNSLLRQTAAFFLVLLFAASGVSTGQEQAATVAPLPAKPAELDQKHLSNYILGPEDKLSIYVRDANEISARNYVIEANGTINLPMLGRVRAGGATIEDFEAEIKLKASQYIRDPDVTVTVTDFRSSPVYVIGAVQKPGIVQMLGPKTLVEILLLAGGAMPDAANSVMVTRRIEYGAIPLPTAITDPNEEFSIAEIGLQDLLQATKPGDNVIIRPFDVVSVPKRESIYVTGEVAKPGAFPPKDRGTLTTLEAITLAGGFTTVSKPREAKILRPILNGPKRYEIPLDLRDIADGKAPDYSLLPGDVLMVPKGNNGTKRFLTTVLDRMVMVGLNTVMWVAIWNVRQ